MTFGLKSANIHVNGEYRVVTAIPSRGRGGYCGTYWGC
jgi:hypothetical protein